jgi:type III secretion protein V
MNKIDKFLKLFAGRQDVVLAIILILAVFMIIIPLPTVVVDALIAINLSVSLLLLMISVYVREPLEFSAFPAVLLITTLYRLSLSISTTRLILMQHDAGEIVYTFGNFAVGGNIGIGLIIFTIITIVQFIVITKGSERVAEVGARFSLDGMPGKQMSIDGDMRAGIIDAMEAKRLRALVQKESQLYGAMDGAMKFVKGDAIASIIIIFVNIFGGVGVGMMVHNMTASQALHTYTILSIGDGLIAQIPALLISITAGIIVTRVPGEVRQNLGTDLAQQMGRQPKPLFMAAFMLLCFALLPGFPKMVFLALSMALLLAGWGLTGKKWRKGGINHQASGGEQLEELKPGSTPIILELPAAAICESIKTKLLTLRWALFERTGVMFPEVVIHANHFNNNARILLYQEQVLQFTVDETNVLAYALPAGAEASDRQVLTLPNNQKVYLINRVHHALLSEHDEVLSYDNGEIYCHLMERVMLMHAKEFIGVQETRLLMDSMEQQYSELVKELQRQLPISKATDILQRLVEEGISIRDLRTIFEALLVWAAKEKDVVVLTEYVRIALRRHILSRHQDENANLKVWVIGSALENCIRESIRQTSAGAYSSLESDQVQRILAEIGQATQNAGEGILLTSLDVRRYLKRIIEREYPLFNALSFQEIGDDARLQVLGNIELIGDV